MADWRDLSRCVMLTFGAGSVRALGEAMVELAPQGDGSYRMGHAGDVYNTIWHLAQLLPGRAAGLVSRVGKDSLSNAFVAQMAADGLATDGIGRDPVRRMGLYLIELTGVERSFHYWRDNSAARWLADDPAALQAALDGAALIHLSGITLAILPDAGREVLLAALALARQAGARVAFDPNIRPRLWPSMDAARAVIARMLTLTDIALPSLDDEVAHMGDADAGATIARMRAAGVAEVVVKNGAGPLTLWDGQAQLTLATPPVADVVDTTGAGDGFNAGYLAARLRGFEPTQAVALGQAVAAMVLRSRGALAPRDGIKAMV
jgi:2-dehydro-3-deoxygluconokinase